MEIALFPIVLDYGLLLNAGLEIVQIYSLLLLCIKSFVSSTVYRHMSIAVMNLS